MWPRYIGDHAVVYRFNLVGQVPAAGQTRRLGCQGARYKLGVIGHGFGADGIRQFLGIHRMIVHRREALGRVFDITAQQYRHRGHHVSRGAFLGRVAHIDGRHGHQAGFRQFILGLEIPSQATTAERNGDIVDRCARNGVLDGLDITEGEPGSVEHPVGRDRVVESGAGHIGYAVQFAFAKAGISLRKPRYSIASQRYHPEGLPYGVELGAQHQFQCSGVTGGLDWIGLCIYFGFGAEVVQRSGDFHARSAVDSGVVHFGEKSEATRWVARHVIQPLNNVQLPQRAAAVQWPGMHTCDLDTELAPITRGRQGDVANMKFRVKAAV